ncbi:hypothetical protein AB833_08730 [Chromatiales bacterium (ex Bugula neritina AB1)]|nr:hypothetical protein AB833_08730 [Chromatiales bacterium (ex Bugula neritina AB1)]
MNDFEILENQARDLFKSLPELEFKTIAVFTLIIGWLLTAEQAQNFIRDNSGISISGTVLMLALLAIFQSLFLKAHYKRLTAVRIALEELAEANGRSVEIARTYELNCFLPIAYACINVLFCIAIVALVVLIGNG